MARDGKRVAVGLGIVGGAVAVLYLATRAEAKVCTPGETKCVGFDLYECQEICPIGEECFTDWMLVEPNSPTCGWEPGEAQFTVSDLIIEPHEVYVGQPVSIGCLVTNIGGKTGTKTITCEVM